MQNKNTEKNCWNNRPAPPAAPRKWVFFSTKLSSLILTKNVVEAPPRAILKKTEAR